MLSSEEILLIMDRLKEDTIVEPTKAFPFKIVNPDPMIGYSKDKKIAALQTKLSIMLEMAQKKDKLT